jgi:hypothetical protein
MDGNGPLAPLLPGLAKLFNLRNMQRRCPPLPLVFRKNLQGSAFDKADPFKGLVQTAFNGHMGTKQRHISSPDRLELHQIGISCFYLPVFAKTA